MVKRLLFYFMPSYSLSSQMLRIVNKWNKGMGLRKLQILNPTLKQKLYSLSTLMSSGRTTNHTYHSFYNQSSLFLSLY